MKLIDRKLTDQIEEPCRDCVHDDIRAKVITSVYDGTMRIIKNVVINELFRYIKGRW